MIMLLGLALITLHLLSRGLGLIAACGLWGLAVTYMMINPQPDPTFASWLAIAGLVAFVIQLALNMGPAKKDDKKK